MNFVQKEDILERVDWWFRRNSNSIVARLEFVSIILTTQQTKRMNKFGVWGNIGVNVYGPHGIEFKKISDIFLGKDGKYKEDIYKVVDESNIYLIEKSG